MVISPKLSAISPPYLFIPTIILAKNINERVKSKENKMTYISAIIL
jgi:hypothetical protein